MSFPRRDPSIDFPPKHDGQPAKYEEDKHAGPHRNDRRVDENIPASQNAQQVTEANESEEND